MNAHGDQMSPIPVSSTLACLTWISSLYLSAFWKIKGRRVDDHRDTFPPRWSPHCSTTSPSVWIDTGCTAGGFRDDTGGDQVRSLLLLRLNISSRLGLTALPPSKALIPGSPEHHRSGKCQGLVTDYLPCISHYIICGYRLQTI